MNEKANDERLARVEQQAQHLAGGMRRIEGKVDAIGESLQILVRIEERQAQTNQRLAEGAQRMNELDGRIKTVEMAQPPDLEKRLLAIETAMPGLKEIRKWVVMGILGGLGMMGAALGHLILTMPK